MSENIESPLEKNYFEDQAEYGAFREILWALDHITPEYISREEFNSKKWDFLKENWKDKFWKFYILYLPRDLKIYELPSIILRVNKITFWEDMPEYASTKELQIKIVMVVDVLVGRLSWASWKDRKEIERALKKYYKLYSQLFWDEEANKLNKPEYVKKY